MLPPAVASPIEALEIVTGKIKQGPIVPADTAAAGGRYLAEDLPGLSVGASFPFDPSESYRSSFDGYALPSGSGLHDELELTGPATGPGDETAPLPAAGFASRVESGALLPEGTWAILPVRHATLLDTGKIRIEQLPVPGNGVLGGTGGPGRTYNRGCHLSQRLLASLLSAGIDKVNVHSLPKIGVLLLGDELIDMDSEGVGRQVSDLNGYWILDSIRSLGLEVVPLGISEDGPAGIHKHLSRCRTRKIDVLLLCGGTGDGINDRSAESIRELNGKVLLERIALTGCSTILYGKLAEMDVIGLSGAPLACAAGFDLFARPLLLARSGAGEVYWNWAARTCANEMLATPPACENPQNNWVLQVGKHREYSSEVLSPVVVKSWNPETPFTPLAAGSQGWVLLPPGTGNTPVFFVEYS